MFNSEQIIFTFQAQFILGYSFSMDLANIVHGDQVKQAKVHVGKMTKMKDSQWTTLQKGTYRTEVLNLASDYVHGATMRQSYLHTRICAGCAIVLELEP